MEQFSNFKNYQILIQQDNEPPMKLLVLARDKMSALAEVARQVPVGIKFNCRCKVA